MIKLSNSIDIYKYLEDIVSKANNSLVLISPFPNFSPTLLDLLRNAANRNVKTIIAYNKSALNESKKSILDEINKLTAYPVRHLQTKWYFNESSMIITSMNLMEPSHETIEEGFYISKNEGYYQEIVKEASDILEENYGLRLPVTKVSDDKFLLNELQENYGLSLPFTKISDDKFLLIEIEQFLKNQSGEFSSAVTKIVGNIQHYLDHKFREIENKLQVIDNKVDQLTLLLKNNINEITSIKKTQREEEEKLSRIYIRLNSISSSINKQQEKVEEYGKIVQDWLEDWGVLNATSKKFLISAEFLWDAIPDFESSDYSPFVIQYCRALENEILKKLFEVYHDDFHNRITNDSEFLKDDLLMDKTSMFANFLKKDKRDYTLGQMSRIMMLSISGGRTLQKSNLLKDFRNFALKYFEDELFDNSYQKSIEIIKDNFRNKAAHPYLIEAGVAMQCQELVRDALIKLLRNYKG